jgi:hypothetical protein
MYLAGLRRVGAHPEPSNVNVLHDIEGIDSLDTVRVEFVEYKGNTSTSGLGTTAFELIVKQQIKRLEEPSLKCISLVYDELVRKIGVTGVHVSGFHVDQVLDQLVGGLKALLEEGNEPTQVDPKTGKPLGPARAQSPSLDTTGEATNNSGYQEFCMGVNGVAQGLCIGWFTY